MLRFMGSFSNAKVMINVLDDMTREQILAMINNKAFDSDLVMMPDTHAGKGSTVGMTKYLTDKVIPNTIGVDINCAMLTLFCKMWHSGLGDDQRNPEIDRLVRKLIPFGKKVHKVAIFNMRHFDWEKINAVVRDFTARFNKKFGTNMVAPVYSYSWFQDFCRKVGADEKYVAQSLGTLGGGNHFIEFGKMLLSEMITITIHCGSRNLGVLCCNYWQGIAATGHPIMSREEWVAKVKNEVPKDQWQAEIKRYKEACMPAGSDQPKGMEFLTGADMYGYLVDMIFVQEYASLNRRLIGDIIVGALGISDQVVESVETAHNYVDFSDWVIRKGAIRSYVGEKMIIPMNMSEGILICEGKSNAEWHFSAPHGAGRIGSREAMKKKMREGKITQDQLEG